VPIRTVQVVLFLVSAALVAILTYLINFTRLGKALQAVAEDQTTASLLGINTEQFITLTFFVSGVLAGVAGTLVGTSVSIAGPYFGIAFGLKGLGVIVLGGLGNIPGAVLGGLVIGLAESFVPGDYSGYKEAIAFTLLFLMLLVRPQGLLGRSFVQKV
jgi:branched-chain amino acid transport system permease protein